MSKASTLKTRILSPEQKAKLAKKAFELHEGGMSFAKIASKLGTTDSTVKKYCNIYAENREKTTKLFSTTNGRVLPLNEILAINRKVVEGRRAGKSWSELVLEINIYSSYTLKKYFKMYQQGGEDAIAKYVNNRRNSAPGEKKGKAPYSKGFDDEYYDRQYAGWWNQLLTSPSIQIHG